MAFPQRHALSIVQDLKLPFFLARILRGCLIELPVLQNWDPEVWNQFPSCCPSGVGTEPEPKPEGKLIPHHHFSDPSWGCDAHVEMVKTPNIFAGNF